MLVNLAPLLEDEAYKKGENVFKKGDIGDCMYFIYEGKISIHEDEHQIAELGSNEILGELALLNSLPRTKSVTASSDSILLKFGQDSFYQLMGENVEFSKGIIQVLIKRLDNQNSAVIENMKNREKELTKLVDIRTKELSIANEELKDFAYVVAHDLKAPLRNVSSVAEWLAEDYADKIDEEGQGMLKILKDKVSSMGALIDGILSYSKAGKTEEEAVKVDLNQLLPEVMGFILLPDHIEIKITNSFPELHCEKTRIHQVFQNLISNAVKYNDKEKGLINIEFEEETDYWKFKVSDNGPGIEEKYHEKIFQIFQKAHNDNSIDSTGIGLSTVKKLVELFEGKIWVESELGKGSTFYFTYPKAKTTSA